MVYNGLFLFQRKYIYMSCKYQYFDKIYKKQTIYRPRMQFLYFSFSHFSVHFDNRSVPYLFLFSFPDDIIYQRNVVSRQGQIFFGDKKRKTLTCDSAKKTHFLRTYGIKYQTKNSYQHSNILIIVFHVCKYLYFLVRKPKLL